VSKLFSGIGFFRAFLNALASAGSLSGATEYAFITIPSLAFFPPGFIAETQGLFMKLRFSAFFRDAF